MQRISRAAAKAASHGMQGMPRPSFSHSTYDEVNSTFVHASPPSRTLALARALETLLTDDSVSTDEIAVFVGLSRHTDEFGDCHPSQTTLAKYMKRSRPWVNARIKRLTELGYIGKERRKLGKGGETSCAYNLPLLDVHSIQIVVMKDGTSHAADTAPCHDDDTPCHGRDTEPDSLELNNNPSLSARKGAFFEKLGLGKIAGHAENANMANATSAKPIQIRPTQTAGTCQMVPTDWQPSADDLAWAAQARPDIDELPRFTAKFIAKVNAGGGMIGPVWGKWRQWLIMESAPRRKPASPHTGTNDAPPTTTNPPRDSGAPAAPAPRGAPSAPSTSDALAARNQAIRDQALAILKGRLKEASTVEIIGESDHE